MQSMNVWPSEGWQAVFRQCATPAALQAAVRLAAIEIARLRRLNIRVLWDEQDLVQKVLAATCAGQVRWDPDAVSLRVHLRDQIRLACRRLRGRNRAGAGVTVIDLDALHDDDAVWGDVETALASSQPEPDRAVVELARRFEAELWQLAADDQIALRVLAAMADGDIGAKGIAAVTGLSVPLVLNARKRLGRLATRISPALRADIRDELNLDASSEDGALEVLGDAPDSTNE